MFGFRSVSMTWCRVSLHLIPAGRGGSGSRLCVLAVTAMASLGCGGGGATGSGSDSATAAGPECDEVVGLAGWDDELADSGLRFGPLLEQASSMSCRTGDGDEGTLTIAPYGGEVTVSVRSDEGRCSLGSIAQVGIHYADSEVSGSYLAQAWLSRVESGGAVEYAGVESVTDPFPVGLFEGLEHRGYSSAVGKLYAALDLDSGVPHSMSWALFGTDGSVSNDDVPLVSVDCQ